MKTFSKILLILLLPSCREKQAVDTLPYYNSPDFTPCWYSSREAGKKITHRIAPFSFTDQHGNTFSSANLEGKIQVADFFFTTCPSICPKMTANFQQLQQNFAGDNRVVLLSFSVMPWADSVPRLRGYAERFRVNSNQWHLLTGSQGAIYQLARQSYFAEENTGYSKDSTEFLHTEHFILADGKGRIRGIYNGTLALETERLTEDIRALLSEGF